jgi:hypothetical protein
MLANQKNALNLILIKYKSGKPTFLSHFLFLLTLIRQAVQQAG